MQSRLPLKPALVFAMMAMTGLPACAIAPAQGIDVPIYGASGKVHGKVGLLEGPSGLLATIELQDVPTGWHAIHVHQTGDCSDPKFIHAGSHANPTGREHGFLTVGGEHAGDMPNVWAGADGRVMAQAFLRGVHFHQGDAALFDADGSAIILHAGADNYVTQPTGNAGDRLACGIVAPAAHSHPTH